MSEVEEGWVGGSFLVVGAHQATIIMHALTHKAASNTTKVCEYLVMLLSGKNIF
jgi:hypothetical protein